MTFQQQTYSISLAFDEDDMGTIKREVLNVYNNLTFPVKRVLVKSSYSIRQSTDIDSNYIKPVLVSLDLDGTSDLIEVCDHVVGAIEKADTNFTYLYGAPLRDTFVYNFRDPKIICDELRITVDLSSSPNATHIGDLILGYITLQITFQSDIIEDKPV